MPESDPKTNVSLSKAMKPADGEGGRAAVHGGRARAADASALARRASRRQLPKEVAALIDSTPADRDDAWERFVARYTRLLLHTAHSRSNAHDGAMDRYTFILEQLRADDFKRLRTFASDGRGSFSTWLVVVARRLCEDYRRRRDGRPQSRTNEGDERARLTFQIRRMLTTLDLAEADWSHVADPSRRNPEIRLREVELRKALGEAMASLEPRDRLLLKLRFEYDLTAGEIAQLLQLPTQFHVYRRLRSRLAGLKRRLEARGVRDAAP